MGHTAIPKAFLAIALALGIAGIEFGVIDGSWRGLAILGALVLVTVQSDITLAMSQAPGSAAGRVAPVVSWIVLPVLLLSVSYAFAFPSPIRIRPLFWVVFVSPMVFVHLIDSVMQRDLLRMSCVAAIVAPLWVLAVSMAAPIRSISESAVLLCYLGLIARQGRQFTFFARLSRAAVLGAIVAISLLLARSFETAFLGSWEDAIDDGWRLAAEDWPIYLGAGLLCWQGTSREAEGDSIDHPLDRSVSEGLRQDV